MSVLETVFKHNFVEKGIGKFRPNQYADLRLIDKKGVFVAIKQSKSTPGIIIDKVRVCPCKKYKMTVKGYSNNCNSYLVALNPLGVKMVACNYVYMKKSTGCNNTTVCTTFCTGPADIYISLGVFQSCPKANKDNFTITEIKLQEVCDEFCEDADSCGPCDCDSGESGSKSLGWNNIDSDDDECYDC